jgi:hypothetical protein
MRGCRATILMVVFQAYSCVNQSCAASASELLEQAMYAEQTLGDLDAAIASYKQITAAENDRKAVAQALLRLGRCYIKIGRDDDAVAAFARLAAEYPEQKDLISKIPPRAESVVHLRPPVEDAEEVFVLRRPSPPLQYAVYRRYSSIEGARNIERIESYREEGVAAAVDVDIANLSPVSGELMSDAGSARWKLTYSPRIVRVSLDQDGRGSGQEVSIPEHTYDAHTLVHLLRRLPLSEGYQAVISEFDPRWGVRHVSLTVVGREAVKVPAGTFEAFRVKLKRSDVDEEEWWYSADDSRYPLKGEPSGLELLAARTGQRSRSLARFRFTSACVSLELPPRWVAIPGDDAIDDPTVLVPLGRPVNVIGYIRMGPLADTHRWGSIVELAANQLAASPRLVPRGAGVQGFELNGVPAARSVSDRSDSVVLYRVHAGTPQRFVSLWFQVPKDHWNNFKATLDEIVASLQLQ